MQVLEVGTFPLLSGVTQIFFSLPWFPTLQLDPEECRMEEKSTVYLSKNVHKQPSRSFRKTLVIDSWKNDTFFFYHSLNWCKDSP